MSSTSRRRSFTSRTLFVLVAIAGVWLGVETNQARRQRTAVRAVLESGGRVQYDDQRRLANTGSEAAPGPDWLRKLIGDEYFQEVVEVDWSGERDLDPDDLRWLSEFPRLDAVNLNFSNVDDEGLAHLANVPRLKTVHLEKCVGVTDVGLSHLASLRQLEYLALLATSCTDEGVRKYILGFPKLTYLDVGGIPVTNETAMELRNLKNLTFVHLGRLGHRATHDLSNAVTSIKRQLPKCQINYWGPAETANAE